LGLRCSILCMPLLAFGSLVPLGTHSTAQQATQPPDTTSTIEINVNRVLIPVVVRDKQGRTVHDLRKEDFQVFDNDKPRVISAFSVEKRNASEMIAAVDTELSPQPLRAETTAPQSTQRFIIFLFDDMHLSNEDLAHSQKAAAAILDSALTPSDMVAAVSISGQTNSSFTRDHAKLEEAMKKLRTRSLYRDDAGGMTSIGLEPNPNANRLPDRSNAVTHAQVIAEQDRRVTFASIAEYVRAMATLPGQRLLILISPGFPLPIDDPGARTQESQIMDLAARSNVTISALNARGLFVAGPNPNPSDESVLAELAYGTGGTFFHNSNDLNAGFKALTEVPDIVYVLELPLDNIKPDGTYHRFKVKVDRDGVDIQARRGYFMTKPERQKK
jgi:VWFA-related protein